jgi:hypothetical protein
LTAAPELKPFKSEQPGVQAVPAVTKTDSVDKTAFSSSATAPSDLEKLFWESVESNRSIQGYQLYLERFPNGYYSSLAQQRIQGINSPAPVNEPPGNDTNTASVADQEQEPITDETSSETDMAGSDTPVTTEAAQPSEKIAGSATAEPVLATVAANQPDRLTDKLTDPDTKQLIEQAWQAFDKKALTTPAGDNAVKWAKMALEKSTQDTAAREVLNAVVDTYISWSRSNLNRGQLARASSYLSKARSLDSYASGPQQTQMTELAGSIRKRQQEVAVTRTRDTRNDSQVPGTLNKLESWLNTDADADFQSHRSR